MHNKIDNNRYTTIHLFHMYIAS